VLALLLHLPVVVVVVLSHHSLLPLVAQVAVVAVQTQLLVRVTLAAIHQWKVTQAELVTVLLVGLVVVV
jgi:hypothetical protein